MPPFRRFRLAGFHLLTLLVVACSASLPPTEDGVNSGNGTTMPASTTVCTNGKALCDGACFDLGTSTAHCGTCETICGVGEGCSLGSCVPSPGIASCQEKLTACDGTCFDLQWDRNHCGGCGAVCAVGQSCVEGACLPSCPAGTVRCNKDCIEPNADPKHCGATTGCGVAGGIAGSICDPGESCFGGQCLGDCASGLHQCPSGCVDLEQDQGNCGTCGRSCGVGKTCSHHTCCAVGFEACMGVCRNTLSDEGACGGCGIACNPGETCLGGHCTP